MGWFLCTGGSNKRGKQQQQQQQQQQQVQKKDDDPIPSTSGKFMNNVQQFIALICVQLEILLEFLCKCALRSLVYSTLDRKSIVNGNGLAMSGDLQGFEWEVF